MCIRFLLVLAFPWFSFSSFGKCLWVINDEASSCRTLVGWQTNAMLMVLLIHPFVPWLPLLLLLLLLCCRRFGMFSWRFSSFFRSSRSPFDSVSTHRRRAGEKQSVSLLPYASNLCAYESPSLVYFLFFAFLSFYYSFCFCKFCNLPSLPRPILFPAFRIQRVDNVLPSCFLCVVVL